MLRLLLTYSRVAVVVVALAFHCAPMYGQTAVQLSSDPDLDISPEQIARVAISAVTFTAAPGLTGATFKSGDDRGAKRELVRGSLGGGLDITLRGITMDAFLGGALGTADASSRLVVADPAGRIVTFQAERSLVSLRGSAGLSLPVTRHVKLRPYASVIYARFEADLTASSNFNPDSVAPVTRVILQDHSFDTSGFGLTLQALYDRWWHSRRLEVDASYSSLYTDTFNESNSVLSAAGWSRTLVAMGRFSDTTGWVSTGRPWRWNIYGSYTAFPNQPAEALGFDSYFEIGAGLDYVMNSKILGLFGLRMFGLKFGMITGDNVEGYSFGITAQ